MINVTRRINKLKAELFGAKDSICFERARIFTESYKRTEGELIAGQRASVLGARAVYPEYDFGWAG